MSIVEPARKPSVSKAIRLCQTAIKTGQANWQTYHRLGTLLSACAELHWSFDRFGANGKAERLFNQALGCFEHAERLLPNDATHNVRLASIVCDVALTITRMSRIVGFELWLMWVEPLYEYCYRLVHEADQIDSAAHHVLAVAQAYRVLPYFGTHLGYREAPDYHRLYEIAMQAEKLFACESHASPDGERDRRWLWFQLAVAFFKDDDDTTKGRAKAEQALWSAIRYRDWEHITRALAIIVFGYRGNSLHRRLRYWRVRGV